MRSGPVSRTRPISFGSSTEAPSPGRFPYISPTQSPCGSYNDIGWMPQQEFSSLDLACPGGYAEYTRPFATPPESPGFASSHLPPIMRDPAAEPRILANLRANAPSPSPYVLNPPSDEIDLVAGIEGMQRRRRETCDAERSTACSQAEGVLPSTSTSTSTSRLFNGNASQQPYVNDRRRVASHLPQPADNPNREKPSRPHHARSRSASESENAHNALTRCILPQPYEDLEDRYELGEILGDGMAGVVRRCREKNGGRLWACKTIAKLKLLCKEDVDALKMEISAMRSLADHGSVVGLHDVLEDEKNVSLIMELCNGGELFNCIIKRKRYPERDAARVLRAILSVIHFMNTKGLMHRDIKPENVVLTHQDSYTNIRVVDFGQAVRFRQGDKLGAFVGSAYYVAPEVLNRSYGPEADMWSLGVLFYALLCGSPPFWAKEKENIFAKIRIGDFDLESSPWNRISEGCKDLVKRMLTMNPADRITPLEAKRHPWMLQFCPIKLPPPEPQFAEPSPSSVLYDPTTDGITHPTSSSRDSKLPPTPPGSGKISPRLPPVYYQKSGTRKAAASEPMQAHGIFQLSEQEWSWEPRSSQRRSVLRLGSRRGQFLSDLQMPAQQIIDTFGSLTKSPTPAPNSLSLSFSSTSSPSPMGLPSPLARSSFPESTDGGAGGGKSECVMSAS